MSQRISIHQENPHGDVAAQLIRELSAELATRYSDLGLDGSGSFSPDDTLGPRGAFVVARLDGQPAGCGALRPLDSESAEVKRMFVAARARRLGMGRAILAKLEQLAGEFGYRVLRLETGRRQPEAIALYEAYGFRHIPPFGKYIGNPVSVCFEKEVAIHPQIMTVRRLQPADAAIYHHLRQCALKDVPPFVGPLAENEAALELSELQSQMARYESDGIFSFGCFVENQCAGVAALSRKLNPKYSHKVFFWGLYVLPAYRGHSVGRRLMEHRIAFARSLPGVRFATLQVTTTNQPARLLHQRFGFVSCGLEPQALNLDGQFYDFELMQLDLTLSDPRG